MMIYLYIHIALSAIIAIISSLILKDRFKYNFILLLISIFIINFCLPIVGYIATLLLSPIITYTYKKKYLHQIKHFNKDEFLSNPYPKVKRVFGEGAVVSLVTDPNNHSPNKMKSLVFMSQHPNIQTHKLIRELLSDKDNEIRLYSFSILNSKEQQLNDQINNLLKQIKLSKNKEEKSNLKEEVAQNYWEFINQGLTEPKNIPIIVERIKHFAQKALKNSKNKAPILLILAKSYFAIKDYSKALDFFNEALKAGIPKIKVLPYLAEIAYEKRDFIEVKRLMQELKIKETHSSIIPIKNIWSLK